MAHVKTLGSTCWYHDAGEATVMLTDFLLAQHSERGEGGGLTRQLCKVFVR